MKNSIIGLKDLRENTEGYINKIKKGRSFVVVKKSKPVFKITPVDEWGDEGIWETVVDFTEIDPKGVPVGKVRKALSDLKER
ncbi:MAG: type II toxin-antitoxin system prevent-host-death family antitoxin [Parcubacteria group bacterium]|nr:type II toxin-antitoxin system prevent-host-death family antitoxin [Parcubacteria group bacterium]